VLRRENSAKYELFHLNNLLDEYCSYFTGLLASTNMSAHTQHNMLYLIRDFACIRRSSDQSLSIDPDVLSKQSEILVKGFTISKSKSKKGKKGGLKGKPRTVHGAKGASKKKPPISVLDAKSRKQVELAVSFVLKKFPKEKIMQALEEMDPEPMGGRDTAQRLILADACFDKRNLSAVQALVLKQDEELAPADEFMLSVASKVPMAK